MRIFPSNSNLKLSPQFKQIYFKKSLPNNHLGDFSLTILSRYFIVSPYLLNNPIPMLGIAWASAVIEQNGYW